MPNVEDDGERFWLKTAAGEAELRYELTGRRLVLIHTGVPPSDRRQGTGGALVQAAVKRATAEGLVLVPVCTFAQYWLREHHEIAREAEIDWEG